MVLHVVETWKIYKLEEKKVITLENNVLRKIFGPYKAGEVWRKKRNRKIRHTYQVPEIIAEASARRLRQAGHVVRKE